MRYAYPNARMLYNFDILQMRSTRRLALLNKRYANLLRIRLLGLYS